LTAFEYPSIAPSRLDSTLWSEALYERFASDMLRRQKRWQLTDADKAALAWPAVGRLYKYRTIDYAHPERTAELLQKGTLWASSLVKLNDPLEAAFVSARQAAGQSEIDAINMMMRSNWYGCICLTIDPVCVQMWAHYSQNHEGFVIEYDRYESSLLCSASAQPVRYRRAMPAVIGDPEDDAAQQELDRIFWTKWEAWEYEREWRVRYPKANALAAPGLLKPSGLIFGLRTSDKDKKKLREYAGKIRIGQIEPSSEPYRLQIRWENPRHA